jgi:thiol:disulfide interchange protein
MPNLKQRTRAPSPTLLILAGIALILIGAYTVKSSQISDSTSSLEHEFDQALQDERPILVFLHSLNCVACKEMMDTVADVYPEFQEAIVLIDVDVYDQSNRNILRREQIQSIPTLVLYNQQGERQVFIGAMSASQFHEALRGIAAGK